MLKKIWICMFFITLNCLGAEKKAEKYLITEGPFFGETVELLKTEQITKAHMSNSKIGDILLCRIAKLPEGEKIALTNRLNNNNKEKKEIFKTLPEKIKKGTVSLCLIGKNEHYIDSNYLKKED